MSTTPLHCRRQGITLGYPFDQLFDRECGLDALMKDDVRIPAIKLPNDSSPGTGNIVIMGPPGSGKSTLALQWAIACAQRPENACNAVYITLEISIPELISKARPFGWDQWMQKVRWDAGEEGNEFASLEDLAFALDKLLTTKTNKKQTIDSPLERKIAETRRVFVCALSPRFEAGESSRQEVFWRRYHQLERLLSAAQHLDEMDIDKRQGKNVWQQHQELVKKMWRQELRCRKGIKGSNEKLEEKLCREIIQWKGGVVLPVVVIDSLNMFGAAPLNRDEIHCLFSLFRKHKRIGVFVVESTQDTPFDSTMADVVVSLTSQKDRGYLVRHFEIQKSRYFNHVDGFHPYKSLSPKRDGEQIKNESFLPPLLNRPGKLTIPRQGIIVYPSLHFLGLRTEPNEPSSSQYPQFQPQSHFGIKAFKDILSPNIARPSVITIEGPRGTFKSSFALNFLAAGLNVGESGLLIRFGDKPLLQSKEQNEHMKPPLLSADIKDFKWANWKLKEEAKVGGGYWKNLVQKPKTIIRIWKDKNDSKSPTLFEIDFKGGMLLPEKFVDLVTNLLIRQKDNKSPFRVVLGDVSQIGVSYPFLRQSVTTGDIFLSAFVHIMRNMGVDLVMTGTTGGVAAADEVVSQACSLADAVVSCQFRDVFGARHVIVRGEGLTAGKSDQNKQQMGESVPGAVLLHGDTFEVNTQFLEGLVGFETGRIQRPGLVIHLYQENKPVHGKYNKEIKTMLQAGFASGPKSVRSTRSDETGQVEMVTFRSKESEAIHGALDCFHNMGKPLDRTVLFTVDEFGAPLENADSAAAQWVRVPPTKKGAKEENLMKWDEFMLKKEYPDWLGYVWPYYSNVLLLAYRTDVEIDSKPKNRKTQSWAQIWKLAHEIFDKGKSPSGLTDREASGTKPPIQRSFWVDLSAYETLACVLLDALQAAHGRKDREFEFLIQSKKQRSVVSGKVELEPREAEEITELCKLLQQTGTATDENKNILPDDSGVYVCWYAQLRELIHRQPALATRLDVCALPGGGFRGDWFAGIVRGSVSPALGQRIIETLCNEDEDRKRYIRGVGLPTRSLFFYPKARYYAWPRSHHVPLAEILPIWENAGRRERIGRKGKADYKRIRADVYAIARQLTTLAGPVEGPYYKDDETLSKIVGVERLFALIPRLLKLK